MNYLGIEYNVKNLPKLEPEFIPFGPWMDAYLAGATHDVKVAVERNEGKISVWQTKIHNTAEMAAADYRYLERYVKFLLWSVGGFRVYICGASDLCKKMQAEYVLTET